MTKYAFFDYCDTLYQGQSLQNFIDFLHQKIKPRNFTGRLEKGLLRLPLHSTLYKNLAFRSLSGLHQDSLLELGNEFYLEKLVPKHYEYMFHLMEYYAEYNFNVTVISGGCIEYLNNLRMYPFISNVIATSLAYDSNKRLVSFSKNECLGVNKIHFINNYFRKSDINWSKSIFYSDSVSDLPLLQKVGKGFVVGTDVMPPKWSIGKFEYCNPNIIREINI